MAISKEEIAASLGVTPQILETVLSTGFRQVQLDMLHNRIEYAKNLNAQISAQEQPAIDAILAKRSARANHIQALEQSWSEAKATPNGAVSVPPESEIDGWMNGE